MTRPVLALAAALIAGTTLTNAAEAGGIRLGFGMPLGSFVAHSFAGGSQQGYGHRNGSTERMYAERAAKERAAKVAAAKRAAAQAQYAEAQARKQKLAAQAQQENRDVEIKTAKVENKTVISDAAPTIYVPNTPETVVAPASVASTAVGVEVAKVAEINDAVKIEAPKETKLQQVVTVEEPVKTEVKTAEKTSSKVERICRRFSAAIAGLVDVPCE